MPDKDGSDGYNSGCTCKTEGRALYFFFPASYWLQVGVWLGCRELHLRLYDGSHVWRAQSNKKERAWVPKSSDHSVALDLCLDADIRINRCLT